MFKKIKITAFAAAMAIAAGCVGSFSAMAAESDLLNWSFSQFAGHTDGSSVLRSVPELDWYGYDAANKTYNTFTLVSDSTATGGYYITNNNKSASKMQAGVYYPGTAIADCTVSTKIKLKTFNSGNAFYVIARSDKASQNYYALKGEYSASKKIKLSIIKCVDGTESSLTQTSGEIDVKTGETAGLWYDVKFKAKGNELSAYFGDSESPVVTCSDSTFKSGGAGIGAVANSGRVWYDYLTITSEGSPETPVTTEPPSATATPTPAPTATPAPEEDIDYFINYDFNDSSINADENGYLTTDNKASYYFIKTGTNTEPDSAHYRAEYSAKSGDDKCIKLVDDESGITQGDQSRLVIPFNAQTTKMISEFDWKGKFINKNKIGHYLTSDGKIALGLEMCKDNSLTNKKQVFVMRKSNASTGTLSSDTYTYSTIEVKNDQWYRIHVEADLQTSSAEVKIYELSANGSANLIGTISGPLAKTGDDFTENPSDISSLIMDTQAKNSTSPREVFVDNFKLAGDLPSPNPTVVSAAALDSNGEYSDGAYGWTAILTSDELNALGDIAKWVFTNDENKTYEAIANIGDRAHVEGDGSIIFGVIATAEAMEGNTISKVEFVY